MEEDNFGFHNSNMSRTCKNEVLRNEALVVYRKYGKRGTLYASSEGIAVQASII